MDWYEWKHSETFELHPVCSPLGLVNSKRERRRSRAAQQLVETLDFIASRSLRKTGSEGGKGKLGALSLSIPPRPTIVQYSYEVVVERSSGVVVHLAVTLNPIPRLSLFEWGKGGREGEVYWSSDRQLDRKGKDFCTEEKARREGWKRDVAARKGVDLAIQPTPTYSIRVRSRTF